MKMNERIEGRKNFPTDEIDPENFLSDDKVKELIQERSNLKFADKDYDKLYNCVHCGECETEAERFILKQKYLEDGNTFEGIDEMLKNFSEYRSPYPSNKMRIKKPEILKKDSNTLLFMGCLSTIRIPKYTEHAIDYLINQGLEFNVLDTEICCGWHLLASGLKDEFDICIKENAEVFKNYEKVICICPACYYLFNTYLIPLVNQELKFEYVADYLKPSKSRKKGNVAIQHLCQLMNRDKLGVDKFVNNVLERSGYNVIDVPHWCCGGGTGWMGRTSVIEHIAYKRMEDFDKDNIDFVTTYCPSCWWILKRFGKKCKIKPSIRDLFQLIM
jgi:Fe-S oxidoreductase